MTAVWRWGIFLADLNPPRGSEQAGKRPVLVISSESYNLAMPVLTVLPLTSKKQGRKIYPNEVLLPAGTGGLNTESIVMAHQIRTISKQRLNERIGSIQNSDLQKMIFDALSIHLELYWE